MNKYSVGYKRLAVGRKDFYMVDIAGVWDKHMYFYYS